MNSIYIKMYNIRKPTHNRIFLPKLNISIIVEKIYLIVLDNI